MNMDCYCMEIEIWVTYRFVTEEFVCKFGVCT